MPIEYSIKAIPTVYNGRRYRSRLEAKWQAFFDLSSDIVAEYEPADFGTWSPDFLIRQGLLPETYVEVKPITEFNYDVAQKMFRSAWDAKYYGNLILLGSHPFPPSVGWIFTETYHHNPSQKNWVPFGEELLGEEEVANNWAEACNIVQWRGKDDG